VKKLLLLLSLLPLSIRCLSTSSEPSPSKEPPAEVPAEPTPPQETPDEVFVREFDECWRVYKECLKSKPDSECFPPHEKCVIAAYRKFKKAKGE
jgi:hypothetical protein